VYMFRAEAKRKIEAELTRGAAARLDGFEGRARVCARRAAGEAVREFLLLKGQAVPGPSAYELLAFLLELPDIPHEVRQTAERLLTRVDQSFQLPLEADLLADAAWLAQALESQLQDT
jgi:hypothetical protein